VAEGGIACFVAPFEVWTGAGAGSGEVTGTSFAGAGVLGLGVEVSGFGVCGCSHAGSAPVFSEDSGAVGFAARVRGALFVATTRVCCSAFSGATTAAGNSVFSGAGAGVGAEGFVGIGAVLLGCSHVGSAPSMEGAGAIAAGAVVGAGGVTGAGGGGVFGVCSGAVSSFRGVTGSLIGTGAGDGAATAEGVIGSVVFFSAFGVSQSGIVASLKGDVDSFTGAGDGVGAGVVAGFGVVAGVGCVTGLGAGAGVCAGRGITEEDLGVCGVSCSQLGTGPGAAGDTSGGATGFFGSSSITSGKLIGAGAAAIDPVLSFPIAIFLSASSRCSASDFPFRSLSVTMVTVPPMIAAATSPARIFRSHGKREDVAEGVPSGVGFSGLGMGFPGSGMSSGAFTVTVCVRSRISIPLRRSFTRTRTM